MDFQQPRIIPAVHILSAVQVGRHTAEKRTPPSSDCILVEFRTEFLPFQNSLILYLVTHDKSHAAFRGSVRITNAITESSEFLCESFISPFSCWTVPAQRTCISRARDSEARPRSS